MSIKRADLDKILHAGALMSNICFNLGQHAHEEGSRLSRCTQDLMRDSQRAWDEAIRVVPKRRRREDLMQPKLQVVKKKA